eukprot:277609-Chlamydomonas_euryale.AAC.1
MINQLLPVANDSDIADSDVGDIGGGSDSDADFVPASAPSPPALQRHAHCGLPPTECGGRTASDRHAGASGPEGGAKGQPAHEAKNGQPCGRTCNAAAVGGSAGGGGEPAAGEAAEAVAQPRTRGRPRKAAGGRDGDGGHPGGVGSSVDGGHPGGVGSSGDGGHPGG